MKNINIIYFFPFKKHFDNKIGKKINKLIYSVLTVNTNINNKIKIYTDFDGYSILSIFFPMNVEIIFYNNYNELIKNITSKTNKPYLFIRNNEILKIFIDFKGKYIINNKNRYVLNKDSIDNEITDERIEETLKEFYGYIYDDFMNALDKKIMQYRKITLTNKI